MKAFQLTAGRGLSSLTVDDRSSKSLASHEIRVRMEAAALNYRDLQILDGRYGLPDGMIVTPGSDGAGEPFEGPAWMIAKEAARRLHVRLVIVRVGFDDKLRILDESRTDATIAPLLATAERTRQ